MMDDVRRKVWLDIFAAPGTLLPIAGGLTALMASWAMGGDSTLTFAGVAGILGGFGVMASRLILGLERITHDAYDRLVQKQRNQQEASLSALEQRLLSDQDPRTETIFHTLRQLYSRLKEKVDSGRVTPAAYDVVEGVDKLFHSCIKQLEDSVDLWETAKPSKARRTGPCCNTANSLSAKWETPSITWRGPSNGFTNWKRVATERNLVSSARSWTSRCASRAKSSGVLRN